MNTITKRKTPQDRFWEKVIKNENPDACWIWSGALTPKGYGFCYDDNKNPTNPHRYSYTIHIGEIPKGLVVRHLCDNPCCVNPKHLALGTIAENNADKTREIEDWIVLIEPNSVRPPQKTQEQKTIDRFWKMVDVKDKEECWQWLGRVKVDGYGAFDMNKKPYIAHRVSWIFTYGDIPPNMFVCHKCDTPLCVNPNHLFLGTPKDNAVDMKLKGRSSYHFEVNRKYSVQQYAEVIKMLREGHKPKYIACTVGVPIGTVYNIKRNYM